MFHGTQVKVIVRAERGLDISDLGRTRNVNGCVDVEFTKWKKLRERLNFNQSATHISCGNDDRDTPSRLIYSVFRSHVTFGNDDTGVDVPEAEVDREPI